METEPERDDSSPGLHPLQLIRLFRLCGRLLAGHLAVCGKLAYVEWELEKKRLKEMALLACASLFCLLLGSIYLIALSLSVVWESAYRAAYLCGFILFFWVIAFFAWRRISALSLIGADRFATVQRELGDTFDILRKHL